MMRTQTLIQEIFFFMLYLKKQFMNDSLYTLEDFFKW